MSQLMDILQDRDVELWQSLVSKKQKPHDPHQGHKHKHKLKESFTLLLATYLNEYVNKYAGQLFDCCCNSIEFT